MGVYLEPSLELTAVECYKLPHLLTLGYCGGMGGGVFGTIFGINSCKLILFWDGWDWLMFCLSVCPSVSNKIKTMSVIRNLVYPYTLRKCHISMFGMTCLIELIYMMWKGKISKPMRRNIWFSYLTFVGAMKNFLTIFQIF